MQCGGSSPLLEVDTGLLITSRLYALRQSIVASCPRHSALSPEASIAWRAIGEGIPSLRFILSFITKLDNRLVVTSSIRLLDLC